MSENAYPKYAKGKMTILLGGQPVELLTTPRVARAIAEYCGGMQGATTKLFSLDPVMMTVIINAAVPRGGDAARNTDQEVFEAGYIEVAGWLMTFVTMVMNKGEPPAVTGTEDKKAGEPVAGAAEAGERPAVTAEPANS